jgi:hypothetical protein
MKIGVFGTGMVGQAISGKLAELGHAVMVGTRAVKHWQHRTSSLPASGLAEETLLQSSNLCDARNGECLMPQRSGSRRPLDWRANPTSTEGLVDIANPLDSGETPRQQAYRLAV